MTLQDDSPPAEPRLWLWRVICLSMRPTGFGWAHSAVWDAGVVSYHPDMMGRRKSLLLRTHILFLILPSLHSPTNLCSYPKPPGSGFGMDSSPQLSSHQLRLDIQR